jgi:Spy/CpxP family protein refolding chaperone
MLLLLVSAAAVAQAPSGGASDDIAQNLFAPDLVFKHREDIGLDDTQSKALKDLVHKAQSQFLDLQWDMQAESGKLSQLLHAPRIDEAAALAEVDKVLAMESAVKKAQLSLLVKIKNLLTPAQQQKLIELRSRTP